MMNLTGNGGPIIWLLAACGAFAAIVFLERLFNLHRAQIAADDFLKGVYNILNRDNTVEAATICEEAPGPVARLALAAVLHHDDTLENIGRAIEDAGLEEIPRMERGLGWLATLARITPLIGLLGTVLGMMDMLLAANRSAPLVQSADLTGGLWAALSATALSLVISILAYAGYNLLVSRVESILLDMERSASALMNFMRQWRRNREAGPA
jgi:biopolymer transport protein ExbB